MTRDRAIAYVVLAVLAAALWAGVADHQSATATSELRTLRARAAALEARRDAVQAARMTEMDRLASEGLDDAVPPTPALSHDEGVELSGLRQRIGDLEAASPDRHSCASGR